MIEIKNEKGQYVPYNHIIRNVETKDIRDLLPFFSKVSLVHTVRELKEAYGYKVSIKKIPVISVPGTAGY